MKREYTWEMFKNVLIRYNKYRFFKSKLEIMKYADSNDMGYEIVNNIPYLVDLPYLLSDAMPFFDIQKELIDTYEIGKKLKLSLNKIIENAVPIVERYKQQEDEKQNKELEKEQQRIKALEEYQLSEQELQQKQAMEQLQKHFIDEETFHSFLSEVFQNILSQPTNATTFFTNYQNILEQYELKGLYKPDEELQKLFIGEWNRIMQELPNRKISEIKAEVDIINFCDSQISCFQNDFINPTLYEQFRLETIEEVYDLYKTENIPFNSNETQEYVKRIAVIFTKYQDKNEKLGTMLIGYLVAFGELAAGVKSQKECDDLLKLSFNILKEDLNVIDIQEVIANKYQGVKVLIPIWLSRIDEITNLDNEPSIKEKISSSINFSLADAKINYSLYSIDFGKDIRNECFRLFIQYESFQLYRQGKLKNQTLEGALFEMKEYSEALLKPSPALIDYDELFSDKMEEIEKEGKVIYVEKELPKISWRGTKRQLYDLFLALHQKGWVKEINFELIERYFENAEDIGEYKDITKPSKFKGIKPNPKPKDCDKEIEDKIIWLGTQKNLAEFFVMLNRQKWIKEIPTNLVMNYFSKSNTLKKVMQKTKDKDITTVNESYPKIYTPNYIQKFDNLPKC